MTPKKVIELAKQSHLEDWFESGDENYETLIYYLQTFAQLVRNEALDGVADVCGFGMSMTEKEMHIADKIRSLKS